MRGARRAGDGDSGGKAQPAAESEDAPAHNLLAAEQMGDAGQVQPEPVRAGQSGARSPAAGGEQAEPAQPGGIAFRIGGADVEPPHQHPRLGERHARREPERAGARAGGGDQVAIADAVRGDEGAFVANAATSVRTAASRAQRAPGRQWPGLSPVFLPRISGEGTSRRLVEG